MSGLGEKLDEQEPQTEGVPYAVATRDWGNDANPNTPPHGAVHECLSLIESATRQATGDY